MAIRNVMLQWGMIQAQVSVEKATDERTKISLNQTHKCCDANGKPTGALNPINLKTVCSGCKAELQRADITKAFQPTKGQYIEITDAELGGIRVPSNGAIIVQEVVKPDLVLANPTLFTGQTYFLQPPSKEKYPPLSYAVIIEMLRGDFALARTAMYNREYTCLLRVGQHGIVMDLIRYDSEMRDEPKLVLPVVDPSYVALAKQIKESMRAQQPKLDYPDLYNEGFDQLIQSKISGLPLAAPAQPAPVAPSMDLKAMLEATLAATTTKKAEPAAVPVTQTELPEVVESKKAAKKGKKGKAA